MIGPNRVSKRRSKDEGEKPFWISFADLMTALMVLFLVTLSFAYVRAQDKTKEAEKAHSELVKQEAALKKKNAELKKKKSEAQKARDALAKEKKKLAKEKEKLARALAELEREKKNKNNRRKAREDEISAFLDSIEEVVRQHEGIVFDRKRRVIDYGTVALFAPGRHNLTRDQARAIRAVVPGLISTIKQTDGGKRWLKRVVVEGFTDDTWTYLGNLNLSLQRSQRVLCVLLAGEYGQVSVRVPNQERPSTRRLRLTKSAPLSKDDERLIEKLFLVGGYSSNSQKATRDESRRIELRLEFYQLDEPRVATQPVSRDRAIGQCRLGAR